MKRRDFMAGLGIAVALPAISRAQQTTPTIGFLSTRSPDEAATHTNAFRRGLEEMGYVEGRSVSIEYRWAKGDYGSLPLLAAELISRPLSLMVGAGDPAARAVKAAPSEVPLVFLVGEDPVRAGLVASMNRPGVATGVNFFTGDLGGKRLELLCAMVPSAHIVGLLVNPRFGSEAVEQQRQAVATAAKALGHEIVVQESTRMRRLRRVSRGSCKSALPRWSCRTIRSSTPGEARYWRSHPVINCRASSTFGSTQPMAG
jgi:putative ABC transport system substrate-binding protein